LSKLLKIDCEGVAVAKRSKAPDCEPRSEVVGSIPGHASNFSTPEKLGLGNNDLQ